MFSAVAEPSLPQAESSSAVATISAQPSSGRRQPADGEDVIGA
jgi:hypothetical protein